MDRIATKNTYDVALLGIYSAENREASAGAQISSGNVASDLKGYAGKAETLIATQTVKARLDVYAETGAQLSDKLSGQNVALEAYHTAAGAAQQAVLSAISTGSGTVLSSTLQSAFSAAADALNTDYQGVYLFSGASEQPPVAVTSLSGLAAPATVADAFQNSGAPTVSRLDDNTTLTTGAVASNVGEPLFGALKSIADYVATNGPFSAQLTSPQTAFLQTTLASFSDATAQATASVAANGLVQKQVAASQDFVTAQQTAAKTAILGITSADVAQASSDLTLAQVTLQASAQVFATLKSSSLLNLLSTTS